MKTEEHHILFESLTAYDEILSSRNTTENAVIFSEIPQLCKEKPCVLGVDEAGRGPTLGPMVYGIAFCPIEKKDVLTNLGCADSKELTEEKRDTIFSNINLLDESKSNIGWAVEVISPKSICSGMLRRVKHSLNEISMDSAIGLIRRAADLGVNIAEVYVDTVGPPEKYQAKLSDLFPMYSITVAKKADSTYPVVSAASICAKVTRDRALKCWKFSETAKMAQENCGSGYPGDPVTKKFLAENIDCVFGYPNIVRFSWSTVENSLAGQAYDVEFNDADENEAPYGGANITKFFKSKNDGPIKRQTHAFFKDRFLESASSF